MKNAVEKSKFKKVTGYVKRCKDTKNDKVYAEICTEENGICKFFDENGFCGLQINCGFGTLPDICKIYPRNFIANGENWYKTLSPTCEAVAEWVVKLKDGIDFVIDKKSTSRIYAQEHHELVNTQKVPDTVDYFSVYNNTVDILQNREFSIEERMVLLGMAFKNLDFDYNEEFDYMNWSEKYGIFSDESFNSSVIFDNIKPNEDAFALNILKNLNLAKTEGSKKFEKFANKLISDFNYRRVMIDNRFGEFETTDRYDNDKYKCCKEKFNNIFADKQYIWENWLILAFTDIIGCYNNFFDLYVGLCYVFGMAKLYMMNNTEKLDTEEGIVDALAKYSRRILHGDIFEIFSEVHNKENDRSVASLIYTIYH